MTPRKKWARPEATTKEEARDCFSEWFRFGFVYGKWADHVKRFLLGSGIVLALAQWGLNQITEKVEIVDDPYSESVFSLSSTAYAGEKADTIRGWKYVGLRVKGKAFIQVTHLETGFQTYIEFPVSDLEKRAYGR